MEHKTGTSTFTDIKAAGCIVYRPKSIQFSAHDTLSSSNLEVILVHRPKYNDWSFPKGKIDLNESAEVAACREVHEETGYPVAINHSLGRIEYDTEGVDNLLTKTRKNVRYYSAIQISSSSSILNARSKVKLASKKEIDSVAWLSIEDALERLTYRDDKKLLKTFCAEYDIHEWCDERIVIEITRVRKKSADKRKMTSSGVTVNKTTRFLASLGIEILVDFTGKKSAVKTFQKYANLTGCKILHFKSPSDSKYLELFNTRNIRMAQIMK